MKNTKKILNNKIHIIFAIFTFLLSFGISFIDISADDTLLTDDEIFKLVKEQLVPNVKGDKYIIYRQFEFGKPTNHVVYVDLTEQINNLKFYDDSHDILILNSGRFNNYNYYLNLNSDGSYSFTEPSLSHSSTISLYSDSIRVPYHSNFNLTIDGISVFLKPLEAPLVEEALGGVELIPTMIIIVGSTICLVGFLLGLRVLLKGLRTVSRA